MASISITGPASLRSTATQRCFTAPRYCHQTRTFTSTSRRSAKLPRVDIAKVTPKQQSINSRLKAMKKGDIPSELGIVPQTFIRPTRAESPSLLSKYYRERLLMEWVFLKQYFKDLIGMYYLNRWPAKDLATGVRNKTPLWFRERASVARRLHQQLYTAIAAGDRATIKEIACTGLAQQQISRIERRAIVDSSAVRSWRSDYRGFVMTDKFPWLLQCIMPLRSIKIVADRQLQLPMGESAVLRQFVARIKSRQTLDQQDGSNTITKQVTEYMVVQRTIVEGEVGDWMVWGTTNPSTYQDAMEISDPNSVENAGKERVMDKMSSTLSTKMM